MNCHDLCYQKHLESQATSRNISLLEAFQDNDFNVNYNCVHLCPLECDSIFFNMPRVERILSDHDFDYYTKRYLNNTDNLKKENILVVKVKYTAMSYIHMSQTVKMSATNLISNIGGVLGLFLELSCFSVYRAIESLI